MEHNAWQQAPGPVLVVPQGFDRVPDFDPRTGAHLRQAARAARHLPRHRESILNLLRRRKPRYHLIIRSPFRTFSVWNTQFRSEDEAQRWCQAVNGTVNLLDAASQVTFGYEKII